MSNISLSHSLPNTGTHSGGNHAPASLQSLSHTPSPIRSPKMGRRVLQRSPKPGGSLASTPTPSESGERDFEGREFNREAEERISGQEKGLDRVLLERNLDRYALIFI